MKKYIVHNMLLAAIIGLSQLQAHAQTSIFPGNHLIIKEGTKLTSLQNLNIKNGGNLLVNGTLILKKDLVNQNTVPVDLGSGNTEFSGSTPQVVSGQNTVRNLLLNNTAGLTIGGNTSLNGILTLTNGLVALGANNLLLGASATVAGTPSSASMVVATGSGELRKEFQAGGSFTFPVGDITGAAEYSPVTLNFSSGNFPAGNYVGVNVVNTVYPDPAITDDYLNRYWNISQSNIIGFNCNAMFQYSPGDVTGNEATLSCTRVFPTPWKCFGSANIALHQFAAAGIDNFGSFTGAKSSTAPVNQKIPTTTVGNGVTACYEATQVLTVGGNGNTFTVEIGGSANLVAGQKILIQSGTTVLHDGYLHAYISNNGIYCGTMLNPLVSNQAKDSEGQSFEFPEQDHFISIYPNPASDAVSMEIVRKNSPSPVTIDLYNIHGEQILSRTIQGETKQQYSLDGLPTGIYIVHASSGNRSEVVKLVKR